ncbi:GDSL-like Lipase/Acylhydrolase [Zalerion maritima]|uniref:GDSL-like Lipase/Acylhydrolase n=1 Tax=Zalerion maritima TaxID=339359 RepID=A0AAD5RQB3_9PEZI|nr:GDSL-like Lipase/Acylhydrolase [Zalerion maritima]
MAKLYPQLILFGDSLLQGSCAIQSGFSLQAALQDHCMRRYDVVNRGMSGYNTSQCLKYLPSMFLAPGPNVAPIKIVIILLGANDAAINDPPMSFQGVDFEGYKENLTAIASHDIWKAHGAKIVLTTPPPLDEIRTGPADLEWGHKQPSRTSKRSQKYSQICRDVAKELGEEGEHEVVLVDLWRGVMDKAIEMCPEWKEKGIKDGPPYLGDPECGLQGGLGTLLSDGLHMNGEAYKVFADLLMPHVKPEWRELPPESREDYVFPDWQTAEWLEKDGPPKAK